MDGVLSLPPNSVFAIVCYGGYAFVCSGLWDCWIVALGFVSVLCGGFWMSCVCIVYKCASLYDYVCVFGDRFFVC